MLTYGFASCFVDHPNGTGVVSAATNANNIIWKLKLSCIFLCELTLGTDFCFTNRQDWFIFQQLCMGWCDQLEKCAKKTNLHRYYYVISSHIAAFFWILNEEFQMKRKTRTFQISVTLLLWIYQFLIFLIELAERWEFIYIYI